MDTIRCVVTGASGSVGYNVSFLVASGIFLRPDQKVSLALLEIPEQKRALEGVKMELEDCAFDALAEIHIGTDPYELFQDADCVFLVGARPRGPGMERKDLLLVNGSIFQEHGKALDKAAKKDVHVLVVGNPCNTNCLIALKNAPSIDPVRFSALTYLDEQRGRALLAQQMHVPVETVPSVAIWGNHSPSLVADSTYTHIPGALIDSTWARTTFLQSVRQRGSEIIKVRGKSSAASAAIAAVNTMKALLSDEEKRISLAVYSKNNPYGIDNDLVFSFPCLVRNKSFSIDPFAKPDDALWKEVLLSENELKEERNVVRHLL